MQRTEIDQRKTKRRQRTESTSEIQPQKKTKNRIDQRNTTTKEDKEQNRPAKYNHKRRQRTESTSEIQPQKKTKNRIDQRNTTTKEDKEQNRPTKYNHKRRQRTESTSEIQPQKKTKNRIDQRNTTTKEDKEQNRPAKYNHKRRQRTEIDQRNMTNYNVRGQRRYRTRKAAARGHNQNADLRNSAPIRKNYCATRLICLRARSSCILSTNPLAEFHAAPPFSVSSIG